MIARAISVCTACAWTKSTVTPASVNSVTPENIAKKTLMTALAARVGTAVTVSMVLPRIRVPARPILQDPTARSTPLTVSVWVVAKTVVVALAIHAIARRVLWAVFAG